MPSEDQIKAGARIIQEEDRLKGTPFESPSRARTGSFGTDQLNSLTEKLMIALGDSTTMDTLTGDPGVLVDRIIAEREELKTTLRLNADELTGLIAERDGTRVINEALLRERDALALDKASRDGLIGDLQAEVARLRAQLPSPPVHEIEILAEMATESGIRVEFKCPYPKCHYEGSVHAPTGGLANRMADALARGHEEEMEEDPDAEG